MSRSVQPAEVEETVRQRRSQSVRELSPDYDRSLSRFSELPSRDRLIAASQERFPAIFNR
jgi:hypothetical protein